MTQRNGLQFTLALAHARVTAESPQADKPSDLAVIDFRGEEALSAPFHLRVAFASHQADLSPGDWLDHEASLTVWQDGQALRRFHGIVSELAQGDRGHRRTRYEVVLRPALWRLSLRHNSRIFQRVSPLTIINTLLTERGITDATFAVSRQPAEREYCVQYRETDLAFIERLAAEEGLCYFHELTPAGHRLVFSDDPRRLTSLGARPYHARAGGKAPDRHVRRLRHTARVRPSSATLKEYSFKQPDYAHLHTHLSSPPNSEERDTQSAGSGEKGYEHFDYPGRYKADASGRAFTQHRLESLRREASLAEAESDLPELLPGVTFTLTEHDSEALNRAWQVVRVVHEGQQPQALEEEAFSGAGMTRYANRLELIPGERPWRPESNPRPRVDGPQVAVVVGPEGEEIHCDEHGRVKVRFPWDRDATGNGETSTGDSSAWLRVSQGWAGGGYGSMALPRIGHEVIVSFLEGDPDQPLITGRTYHAVNTPPYALPEHKTRTVLRTQTHKGEGFNELRFEDEKDQQQIWLHAQKDLELLTRHDRREEVLNDSTLRVQRDRITEIERDEHFTVQGERRTKIKGDQSLSINGSLHLKIGQAWLSESGRELHIKAGQKVVLEAGSELTLNAGGSFVKLDASGIALSGPTVKLNSGGSPGTLRGQDARPPLLPQSTTDAARAQQTPSSPTDHAPMDRAGGSQAKPQTHSQAERQSAEKKKEFIVDIVGGGDATEQVRLYNEPNSGKEGTS